MSVYDDLCDEDSILAFVDNVSKKIFISAYALHP
jgi:hypothetical protein